MAGCWWSAAVTCKARRAWRRASAHRRRSSSRISARCRCARRQRSSTAVAVASLADASWRRRRRAPPVGALVASLEASRRRLGTLILSEFGRWRVARELVWAEMTADHCELRASRRTSRICRRCAAPAAATGTCVVPAIASCIKKDTKEGKEADWGWGGEYR